MGVDSENLQAVAGKDAAPSTDVINVKNYLMRTGASEELADKVAQGIASAPKAATSQAYIKQAAESDARLTAQTDKWRDFMRPIGEYLNAGQAGGQGAIEQVTRARTDPASQRPLQWDQPMQDRNNFTVQRQALMTNQTAGQLMKGYGLPPDIALKLSAQMTGYQIPPTVPAVQ